jgi:hypothetical protein
MAMVHSSFYGIKEVEPPSAANGNHTSGKSIVDCRLRDFIPLNAIHLGKIIVGS